MRTKPATPKPRLVPTPPSHLSPGAAEWFSAVISTFDLDPHDVRLLTLAGEAWDRAAMARAAVAEHGLVFDDR